MTSLRELLALLALVAVATLPSRASADTPPRSLARFDYSEHCRVSDRGFRLAWAHFGSKVMLHAVDTLGQARFRSLGTELGLALGNGGDCREGDARRYPSYGHLVARVDFARRVSDFYNDSARTAILLGADSIPWTKVLELNGFWNSVRAWRENGTHFQNSALMGFLKHHDQAIRLAAEGKLKSALVTNAFADHYLQDHYAPGHIVTPRNGLHDAASNSLHDQYNREGLAYLARNTDSLLQLIDVGEIGETLLESLGKVGCSADEVRNCLKRLEHDTSLYRGDAQLGENALQELLMSLVIARSIADLFEAYLRRTSLDVSHFKESTFEWKSVDYRPNGWRASRARWTNPIASITYGTYIPEERVGNLAFDNFTVISATPLVGQPNGSGGSVLLRVLFPMAIIPPEWQKKSKQGRSEIHHYLGPEMALGAGRRNLGVSWHVLYPLGKGWQVETNVGFRLFDGALDDRFGYSAGGHIGWGYSILFATVGVERLPFVRDGTRVRNDWALTPRFTLFTPTPESIKRWILGKIG